MELSKALKKCARYLSSSLGCGWSQFETSKNRPIILSYCCCKRYLKISIIDGVSEQEMTNIRHIKLLYSCITCCKGLVLVWNNCYDALLLNPCLSPPQTLITKISRPPFLLRLCCFFYHPVAQEYRILCLRKTEQGSVTTYEYFLYLFKSETWRRISGTPCFEFRPPFCGDIDELFKGNRKPAILHNTLNWHINSREIGMILVFDMMSEKFSVRGVPPPTSRGICMEDILVKGDRLCFCRVANMETVINIWILDDYDVWSWTRMDCIVDLDWDICTNKYPIKYGRRDLFMEILFNVRVISIRKDHMVFYWRDRGMFSYHLRLHTVDKIPLTQLRCHSDRCGFETFSD